MVDFEKILNMTWPEIQVVKNRQEMVREALEMSIIAGMLDALEIEGDGIIIFEGNGKDGHVNGRWIKDNGAYEVKLTGNGILECLIDEFLVNNDLIEEDDDKAEIEHKAKSVAYFRDFIERTKKEHPEIVHALEEL